MKNKALISFLSFTFLLSGCNFNLNNNNNSKNYSQNAKDLTDKPNSTSQNMRVMNDTKNCKNCKNKKTNDADMKTENNRAQNYSYEQDR